MTSSTWTCSWALLWLAACPRAEEGTELVLQPRAHQSSEGEWWLRDAATVAVARPIAERVYCLGRADLAACVRAWGDAGCDTLDVGDPLDVYVETLESTCPDQDCACRPQETLLSPWAGVLARDTEPEEATRQLLTITAALLTDHAGFAPSGAPQSVFVAALYGGWQLDATPVRYLPEVRPPPAEPLHTEPILLGPAAYSQAVWVGDVEQSFVAEPATGWFVHCFASGALGEVDVDCAPGACTPIRRDLLYFGHGPHHAISYLERPVEKAWLKVALGPDVSCLATTSLTTPAAFEDLLVGLGRSFVTRVPPNTATFDGR